MSCDTAGAQTMPQVSPAPKRQLVNITEPEANELIQKLKQAQRQLKAGESPRFELLTGSLAFLDAIRVSPREAFLAMPFDRVWEIERSRTDNRLWQPYKLAYAPKGPGQLYWKIEVVLGFYGDIERITMVYKPPAPF